MKYLIKISIIKFTVGLSLLLLPGMGFTDNHSSKDMPGHVKEHMEQGQHANHGDNMQHDNMNAEMQGDHHQHADGENEGRQHSGHHDGMNGNGQDGMNHENMNGGSGGKGMDHASMQGNEEHHDHAPKRYVDAKTEQKLGSLKDLPGSGKGREAGFDERYTMESTSVTNSIETQCAQATRGIVMVDNDTWAKCGGKPKGWAQGIEGKKAVDHSQHMMH